MLSGVLSSFADCDLMVGHDMLHDCLASERIQHNANVKDCFIKITRTVMVQCLHTQVHLRLSEGRPACALRRPVFSAKLERGWDGYVLCNQDKRRRVIQRKVSCSQAVKSAGAGVPITLTKDEADEKDLPGGVKEGAQACSLAGAARGTQHGGVHATQAQMFPCARLLGMEWIQDTVSAMRRRRPTCAGYSWIWRQLVWLRMPMPGMVFIFISTLSHGDS